MSTEFMSTEELEIEVEFEFDMDLDDDLDPEEPGMWNVILHNDDQTPMDFVVHILLDIFHMEEEAAVKTTTRIHHHGRGIAGTFTHEIAEEKAAHVMHAAQSMGFPLRATVEEE